MCTHQIISVRKEKLAFISTSLLLLALLLIFPVAASVSDWEYSPQEPFSGDILSIKGTASPDEKIDAFVTFEKTVPVSGGEFEYILEDVKIPDGFNNVFKVEADGAENLNVRVKMVVWVTKSSEASGNTAIVSQSSVPPGTYRIKIDGDAREGVSNVNLKITAFQGIEADSDGKFSYSYSTKAIPSGDFELKVGGMKKIVTIKSKETSESISDSSSNDPSSTETSSKDTSSKDTSSKDTSSKDTSVAEPQSPVKQTTSETVNEKGVSESSNSDEKLVRGDNQTKLSGKTAPVSESPKPFVEKFYLLAGMGMGLLILIVYSRRK
jgi:hypothetical protein